MGVLFCLWFIFMSWLFLWKSICRFRICMLWCILWVIGMWRGRWCCCINLFWGFVIRVLGFMLLSWWGFWIRLLGWWSGRWMSWRILWVSMRWGVLSMGRGMWRRGVCCWRMCWWSGRIRLRGGGWWSKKWWRGWGSLLGMMRGWRGICFFRVWRFCRGMMGLREGF